jgi:hypothetical protein
MMKTSWFKFASITSLAFAAVTACGASDINGNGELGEATNEGESMSLGTAQQGVMSCTNPDGANSAMAALAVAVAQDLGRWQATKDFVIIRTSGASEMGPPGQQESIKLATGSDLSGPKGKSRCADGTCARVQALLDMQYDQIKGQVYFQGTGSTKVLVDPVAVRSRMTAKFREQGSYDGRARDGAFDQAPREEHKLAFVSAAKGGCDTMFTFQATKPDGTALRYPNQLKYKLAFADIHNPYIGFQNLGNGKVAIDPTWGLNEDGTSSSGSCAAACTKVSLSSVVDQCCSCGGVPKKFKKALWSATTFLCE